MKTGTKISNRGPSRQTAQPAQLCALAVGHEQAGEPLSPGRRHALDAWDEVLQRPALRVEFTLEPGQVYFINNRWILHNRTAFVDHPEPELRRHLVRLWLAAGPEPA